MGKYKNKILASAGVIICGVVIFLIQQCWNVPVVYPTKADLQKVENTCNSSITEVGKACAAKDEKLDQDKLDKETFVAFQKSEAEYKKMESEKNNEIRKIQSDRFEAHSRYISELNKQVMRKK
jgi:predicted metal-binding transcription factor (methanogenesis marker protein 9)